MNFRVGTLRNRNEDKQASAEGDIKNRLGWLLTVCCVAQFMVILDLSIVNVALPSIQSDLGFTPVNLQWVVDAYAIVFAGFLMLGGRASDRFGPRRMLAAALVLFALASLAGGAASSQGMLIAARSVQGLSGALMAASSLAAIAMSFPQGPARHRAIALWGAMNGAGGAAGALFGGIITQEIGWRWVLLINPPIGVAAAGVAWVVIAEGKKRVGGLASFDLPGAITLTIGQMILVYGIVEAGTHGWGSPLFYVPLIIALVLFALFTVIEARWASDPLIPFKAITKPLADANTIVFVFSAGLLPMWFISSLYLQEVLGLSPLLAGLCFFPMALTIMLVARRAGVLVGMFGLRAVLTSGLVLFTAGLLMLARIGPTGSSIGWVVLPGVLTAAGIGLSVVASTIAATQSVAPSQAGLASGLVNTSRQAGGGLGIALLITFATSYTTHLIGHNKAVPDALTSGFRLAYLISAGLGALASVLAFRMLRHAHGPARQAHPAQPPAAAQAPAAEGGDQPAPAGAAVPAAVPAAAAAEAVSAPAAGSADGPGDGAPAAPAAKPARMPAHWRLPAIVLGVLAVFATVDFGFAGHPGAPIGAYKLKETYSFRSAPSLHPPVIRPASRTNGGTPAPGYILTGLFYDLTKPPMTGQSGPLMLDNSLQPVWYQPVPQNMVASNLDEQTYLGQPVLTWWQGVVTNTGQTSSGEYIVVNQHYQTVARLHGADGWVLTLHTMVIDGGNAWVTANKNLPMNLSKWGGVYNGTLVDSALQEYNIKTGKLVRSWDAFKHIGLGDTHSLPPGNGFPWDAYHINSIDMLGRNTALVSMRDTWGVYKIDTRTGKIIWTLGGNHSDFTFGKHAQFKYQHDVTMLPNGDISMFDDHCCFLESGGTYLAPTGPSRAEVLRLNMADHKATLVRQYRHHDEDGRQGTDASYMGSAQLLPNGNMFVGYGNLPFFAEYSKSGDLVMDALFPGSDLSYRAIKIGPDVWTGLPLTKPAGAVRVTGGRATVYASWNGATGVQSWRVLAGPASGQLSAIATTTRSGFETAIGLSQSYAAYQVQALDAHGKVIGTSAVFASRG